MNLDRNPLKMGANPALILVDMIKGFTDPACALGSDCPSVIAANAELLSLFRQKGLPVFFTTVVYHTKQEAKVFRERLPALNVLTPSSDWVKVDAALTPKNGEPLIEKKWASAFFQTDLNQQLRDKGVDSLIITGLTTSGCVRASVIDSLQHDFPTFVPREAVGDRNQQAHDANLFDMHAKYADVLSLKELKVAVSAV